MKYILAVFILLCIHHSAYAESLPEWYECKTDADCQITVNECGALTAVNKDFLSPAESYFHEMGPRVNCVTPTQQDIATLRTICIHQKTACMKEKWFGLVKEIDPASTCVNAVKTCAITQKEIR